MLFNFCYLADAGIWPQHPALDLIDGKHVDESKERRWLDSSQPQLGIFILIARIEKKLQNVKI